MLVLNSLLLFFLRDSSERRNMKFFRILLLIFESACRLVAILCCEFASNEIHFKTIFAFIPLHFLKSFLPLFSLLSSISINDVQYRWCRFSGVSKLAPGAQVACTRCGAARCVRCAKPGHYPVRDGDGGGRQDMIGRLVVVCD